MIEIHDLSYKYPGSKVNALHDINVKLPPEHVFAILGHSGSGKTTLLNCIAQFLRPTIGKVTIDGQNIATIDKKTIHSIVGVVFQKLNLFPHLTVMKNMTLAPINALGIPEKQAQKSAMEMLEKLSIADLAQRYPLQISGGQAQRVAIARALMLQPRYMLLDEPTSALDSQTTSDFAEWLTELQEETCFIIVTHDLPFAQQVASHGIFLQDGVMKTEGNIQEIIDQQTASV
ncbi:MAG: ATP-binding cassette domain-containing protein [Kiritimatiellae bacterium]|jgi:ABC-type polar amino acid transport system ATPase subunit|nr:ATP-binding cassette domain-containing protein [Kiritimatiellia bacterium]